MPVVPPPGLQAWCGYHWRDAGPLERRRHAVWKVWGSCCVSLAPEYDGNSAFNSGGDFIGVLESSENKSTAWEFVKFVTQDPDSLKTMYQANDLYPAWTPALDQSWMNQPDPFYAGQNVNEVFASVSEDMKPPVTTPTTRRPSTR